MPSARGTALCLSGVRQRRNCAGEVAMGRISHLLKQLAWPPRRRNIAETWPVDDVPKRTQPRAEQMAGTYGSVLTSSAGFDTVAHEALELLAARAPSSASAI